MRLARDGWRLTSEGHVVNRDRKASVWLQVEPPMTWEKRHPLAPERYTRPHPRAPRRGRVARRRAADDLWQYRGVHPPPNRRPYKSTPTFAEYLEKRRERTLAGTKTRRHEALWNERLDPHPYRGQQYYYVLHGHAGIPSALAGKDFELGVDVNFYCFDGETTDAARKRNVNADWPKLFARLTTGNTLPSEHVAEVVRSGEKCAPLILVPQHDVPNHGVYFVCRYRAGDAPHTVEKLREIKAPSELCANVIRQTILPDAVQRGLHHPINVHWIACRAHLGAPMLLDDETLPDVRRG